MRELWKKIRRMFGGRVPGRCAAIYLDAVKAEHLAQKGTSAAVKDDAAEEMITQLEAKLPADRDRLRMRDVLLYERLTARLLSVDGLRRKVMTTRARYRQMVSPETYQLYVDAGLPNPLDANEAQLRADLDDLFGRIQGVYIVAPFREEMRTRISLRVTVALAIWTAALVAILWWFYGSAGDGGQSHPLPIFFIAILAGALGGLLSVQQRIQSAPTDGDALRSVMSLDNGMLTLYLAPVVGAFSAGLMFLLLAGGYVSGDMFPKLEWTDGTAPDVLRFMQSIHPKTGADLAKLVIWGFLAGFAERLVPDTLSRVVESVQAHADAPPRSVVQVPATLARNGAARGNGNHEPATSAAGSAEPADQHEQPA